MNDLLLPTNNSLIEMFADDSTMYISGNNITTIQYILQDDLTNIKMLCDVNNITVNPTKSTCMLIGSTHRVNKC